MPTEPTVSDYLVARLKEHGVEHVFTIPGDYFAAFLDRVDATEGIESVLTVNELEAGYAADGYARVRGLSCLAVQYGVGTLSAINAVAGAARERVPMLVLTGAPPRAARDALLPFGVVFHHSTDAPMEAERRIFAELTATAEVISSVDHAAETIDQVIDTAIARQAPVYLQIWADVQRAPLPAPQPRPKAPPAAPASAAEAAADAAMALLAGAKQPLIWAGLELQRYRLRDAFQDLVAASGVPFVTSLQAKGVTADDAPLRLGTYVGGASDPALSARVMAADCVLELGVVPIDYYRGLITTHYDRTIAALDGGVRIGHAQVFSDVPLPAFIAALTARIRKAPGFPRAAESLPLPAPPAAPDSATLTYDNLFAALGGLLPPDAFICCDLGIGMFMAADLRLKSPESFIVQADWASLGFAAPCALGVALAEDRPVLAICGDGSFRMVVQTLATHAKPVAHPNPSKPLRTTILLLDNAAYGLEQAFTGAGLKAYDPGQSLDAYNVLADWDYPAIARAMGLRHTDTVKTVGSFRAAMQQTRDGGPRLVRAVLSDRDMPQRIRDLVASFAPKR